MRNAYEIRVQIKPGVLQWVGLNPKTRTGNSQKGKVKRLKRKYYTSLYPVSLTLKLQRFKKKKQREIEDLQKAIVDHENQIQAS